MTIRLDAQHQIHCNVFHRNEQNIHSDRLCKNKEWVATVYQLKIKCLKQII